jgi:hypothetical protein
MSEGPAFEDYLISKKIDSGRFRDSEPQLWKSWKDEFEKMHPNSFTVQKLNLINPIRRKYQLSTVQETSKVSEPVPTAPSRPVVKPGRPVIKPKSDQGPPTS